MALDNILDVVTAGFIASSLAAYAGVFTYSAVRLRPLPPELVQLWLFKNFKAVSLSMVLLSFGVMVGLASLFLDKVLDPPLEDTVVLAGGLVTAALTFFGTWKALWVLREVRERPSATGRNL